MRDEIAGCAHGSSAPSNTVLGVHQTPTEQQPHKTSQGLQQSCQIHYQQEVTIKNAFITQRIPKIPKNRNSSECTGNASKIMGWSFCYKAQEKIWQ